MVVVVVVVVHKVIREHMAVLATRLEEALMVVRAMNLLLATSPAHIGRLAVSVCRMTF